MTYPDTPAFSTAPAPSALRRRVRRAFFLRRLSAPLMALGFLGLIIGVSSLYLPLIGLGALLGYLGLRWSGRPMSDWVHGVGEL